MIYDNYMIGGRGGSEFREYPPKNYKRLAKISIYYTQYVQQIQFAWETSDGSIVWGSTHGEPHGQNVIIDLAQDEYISSVTGRAGIYIDKIAFKTNRRYLGPYGGSGGENSFGVAQLINPRGLGYKGDGKVVGLFGAAGGGIDRIGFIVDWPDKTEYVNAYIHLSY
ncbi:jacalin-like lectin [Spirosoma aerophilum]